MFDKDGSGEIDVQDLEMIFQSIGRNPEEAKSMIEGLDKNKDDKISFKEFMDIMT